MAFGPNTAVAMSLKLYSNIAMTFCFCVVCHCFLSTDTELSSCETDHFAYRALSTYCLALCRKSLPMPDLDFHNALLYFIFYFILCPG